jgi:hypothetical protein
MCISFGLPFGKFTRMQRSDVIMTLQLPNSSAFGSAMGHEQTLEQASEMSALLPKADIHRRQLHVR